MPIRYSSSLGGGVPSGATADRPASPEIGDTFYNGTLGVLEIYTESGWQPATGANDFNLTVQNSETVVLLSRSYIDGAYTVESSSGDIALDVYLFNGNDELVGSSSASSILATSPFSKVVVIGGTVGDLLSFSYKTTFAGTEFLSSPVLGPVLKSITPTSLPTVDDSTTIVGKNFSTDIQIYFVGTDNVSRIAKSVVYVSDTQVIATRPDSLPAEYGPYSVKAIGPDRINFPGSGSNILSNSASPGTKPSWQTNATMTWDPGVDTFIQLSASDSEETDIDYTVISGTLPQWLSLDTETGLLSKGVATPQHGESYSFTIRAIDTGGNYLDRQFSLSTNSGIPVWTTASSLGAFYSDSFSGLQLSASSNYGLTYSIVSGALPPSLSMSSDGFISGTITADTNSSFTVRATDPFGAYAERQFSGSFVYRIYEFISHTFTTAGVRGQTGPTLSQVQSAYSSSTWSSTYLDMPIQGYQRWTVPLSGTYRITAAGAGSSNFGYQDAFGAVVAEEFSLVAGEKLLIAVGQYGADANVSGSDGHSAGSGGTFVARGSDYTTATPLIVGGGAGGNQNGRQTGSDGGLNPNGASGISGYSKQNTTQGLGWTDLSSNTTWGAGGGGFYTSGSGSSQQPNAYGRGFRQGLTGGSDQSGGTTGGFGGGAGGHYARENEGGGGYTGGPNGGNSVTAGGGGSYSASGAFKSASATNPNPGYVLIEKL